MTSKFLVKRLSKSPYFLDSFFEYESKIISGTPNVEMLPMSSTELADILITNTHTKVESLSCDQLSKCKLMIHPNSGYDNFTTTFVKNNHFPIIIGNPIRAHAVTNFILTALFNHFGQTPTETKWNQSRHWKRKLLSESKILLIGQGHVGSLLKKSLSPLAKELRVYDPYINKTPLELKEIDVIIPVCSLNAKNQYMIDRHFLSQCNNDFLIINAARGHLVHTTELIEVLNEQPNAFAILDVFEKEPMDFSLFAKTPNVKLSSHMAGVFTSIDTATISFEENCIRDFTTMDPLEFERKYKKLILKHRLIEDDFLI